MMPPLLRATALEYKHRYLIHGVIFTLGLAAPWQLPVWGFLQNGSSWFLVSNALAKPSYQNFALDWNGILLLLIVFSGVGAGLRTWGAAYLGATTVHRGSMEGDRIIAAGPYRFVRNPLYLGTILHAVALAMLMRPVAAIVTVLLIVLVQLRLIGREEPYLASKMGDAYLQYMRTVPRLLPSVRPRLPASQATPDWKQGVLSELYMLGVFVSFTMLGWSSGFAWETTVLHVVQGIVVALGLSVVARAFIPKSQM